MMNVKKFVALAAIVGATSVSGLTVKADSVVDGFSFTGSGTFEDGNTYEMTLKDAGDNALELAIDGVDGYAITGSWIYEDGKGIKFYFDDDAKSTVYTTYDEEDKEFKLNYRINLGDGFGVQIIPMEWKNEDFADVYDGEGLGKTPPQFVSVGYLGRDTNSIAVIGTLNCMEDGTCMAQNESWRTETGGDVQRTGKWTYDEDNNEYTIIFDEPDPELYYHDELNPPCYIICDGEGNKAEYTEEMIDEIGPYVTTYDEKTGAYSLKYEQACIEYVWRVGTWTPENE